MVGEGCAGASPGRRAGRSLDAIPADTRGGQAHEAGEITAEDIAHQWAYHDLMHIKQNASILQAGLIGRMGNTRKFYDV